MTLEELLACFRKLSFEDQRRFVLGFMLDADRSRSGPDDRSVSRQPTGEEHAADVRAFVEAVDAVLIDGLRLSREHHSSIFHARSELQHRLRDLLEDRAWVAAAAERQRIKDRIVKDLL